jgi:flagellar basal-body rod protein FlgB
MFLDQILNDGSAPVMEQWLSFTEARQRLLGEDIVNATTPNYLQKDLSLQRFQSMLRDRVNRAQDSPPGTDVFSDISMDVQQPKHLLLYHDGNNRSMEQLMTDNAKNALMHTLAVELLRRQYNTLDMALKERAG